MIPYDMYHDVSSFICCISLAAYAVLASFETPWVLICTARVFPSNTLPAKEPYNQDEIIATYKRLIRSMPRPNQYLLLYVLDLLSVFSRKSNINLMNATSMFYLSMTQRACSDTRLDLAVIFRPGLISHPEHEMSPKEHSLSQRVLEFLIAQQDWFMLDIPPPAPGEFAPNSSASEDPVTVSDDEGSRRVTRRRTTIDRGTPA